MTFEDLGGVRFSILLSFYAKARLKGIILWHDQTILPEFNGLGKFEKVGWVFFESGLLFDKVDPLLHFYLMCVFKNCPV